MGRTVITAVKRLRTRSEELVDRISSLPDEVIHKILSFLDIEISIQTSALSRRWRFVWRTLPYLNLGPYNWPSPKKTNTFFANVLSKRDGESHVSKLSIHLLKSLPKGLLEKFIQYAKSHGVQDLDVQLSNRHFPYELSTFSSQSLVKLKLYLKLKESVLESECWDLPSLTTLDLECPVTSPDYTFSELCVTSLPALKTLGLKLWDFRKSSLSFSWPALTSLRMYVCKLCETMWNMPALRSLDLNDVLLPRNITDILSSLPSLQNLSLFFNTISIPNHFIISCPQLVNLNIGTHRTPHGNIIVLAPKLHSFSSLGIFSITFGVSELETATIRLRGWIDYRRSSFIKENLKEYYERFIFMFPGLGGFKILSLELETIEALNKISDFLVRFRSPFYKLEHVKLPEDYSQSIISSALRSYLLGASPRAMLVETWCGSPRPIIIKTSSQLDDVQGKGVAKNSVVENSVVDVDRVRETDVSVERVASNDRVSSLKGNKDSGLWRGYEMNSEFVCLLDLIMNKYPETFEHFTTKNKKLGAMKLHMLCTSLNDFTKISMGEVTAEVIAEYMDVFTDLEKSGFNVSWVVRRLNYIEHVRFSQPLISELHALDRDIDVGKRRLQDVETPVDIKTKLHDPQSFRESLELRVLTLQNLRVEKMTEIEKAFGTMGSNLAVGYIGDGLL